MSLASEDLVHLVRTVYSTDYDGKDPIYPGRFSSSIPKPDHGMNRGSHIIAVDWSTQGEVEVTWLVSGPSPAAT